MGWLSRKINAIVSTRLQEQETRYKALLSTEILQLKPDSTYILVVPSDDVAKDLQQMLLELFQGKQPPRIVIVSARNVSLIELAK